MRRSKLARPAWLGSILLSVQFVASPAPAAVTVANCGGEGSDFDTDCSLAELLARPGGAMPSITIDDTVFDNFTWNPGFTIPPIADLGPHSDVKVLGIDSWLQPALKFTDTGTPAGTGMAWHRTGGLLLVLGTLTFDIKRTQGAAFDVFGRRLFATFGQVNYYNPLDPEVSDSVFLKDRMFPLDDMGVPLAGSSGENEASVQCYASEEGHDVGAGVQPSCAFTSRRDSHPGTPRLRSAPQPQPPWFPWHYYRATMDFHFTSEAIFGETELDEFIYQLELAKVARVLQLPDINGNGRVDVGALFEGPTGTTVEIREGADPNQLLKRMTFFDLNHRPIAAVWIPDADGDGSGELAVLARRIADGRGVVEIRNLHPASAENPRQIEFRAGHRPLGIVRIPVDVDGNNVPEIAVLSQRTTTAPRGLVEVVNAFGPRNLIGIWQQSNLLPRQIVAVEDSDMNGVPEVAVLAQRNFDARTFVEVANADNSGVHNVIDFRPRLGDAPVQMAALGDNDGDGVAEVALLILNSMLTASPFDDTGFVDIRNVYGANPVPPTRRFQAAPAGHQVRVIRAVNDANNDGTQEVAVVSSRYSDGEANIRVAEATGLGRPNDIQFPPVFFEGRGMQVLDGPGSSDPSGNGVPDVALMLLRASDGRIVINTRNAAGPSTAATGTSYFFVP